MPRYRMKDGKVFEARGLAQLVELMWADARVPVPLAKWMHETAIRAASTTGCPIYGDGSRTRFAQDLIRAGLVKQVE